MTHTIYTNIDGNRCGETHQCAKLSDNDVDLIRQLVGEGLSKAEVARKFECAESTVRAIAKGDRRSQPPVYAHRRRGD